MHAENVTSLAFAVHAIRYVELAFFIRRLSLSLPERSAGVTMGRRYHNHHVSTAIWMTIVSARGGEDQHPPADTGCQWGQTGWRGSGAFGGRGVCGAAVSQWW